VRFLLFLSLSLAVGTMIKKELFEIPGIRDSRNFDIFLLFQAAFFLLFTSVSSCEN
jgi:hypothetical protein